jgi:hypothetical protein
LVGFALIGTHIDFACGRENQTVTFRKIVNDVGFNIANFYQTSCPDFFDFENHNGIPNWSSARAFHNAIARALSSQIGPRAPQHSQESAQP